MTNYWVKNINFLVEKRDIMSNYFIVETSARHIHLTKEDVKILFGANESLNVKKSLSQPGQFASDKKLTVVGSKGELKNVTILGPERNKTQIELSATDARSIGIAAPIRESGDIQGSASCKLVGPAGEIDLSQGVIIAKRHVHLTPKRAAELKVKEKQIVWVKVTSESRTTIFGDVVIRVSPNFSDAMHLDTDEANAVCATRDTVGEIINI